MKMAIESTTRTTEVNGVKCRIWEGVSGRGVRLIAFIPLLAVRDEGDSAEFERELKERSAPSAEVKAWPLRMIL